MHTYIHTRLPTPDTRLDRKAWQLLCRLDKVPVNNLDSVR